ncbi:DUF932 domain-containing protein [Pseudonocardia sp. NPDC049635]|uniref:DUF932 domain-containing protein n=1 Tax=Pseudonocardia sp. NPDC049635 TaxID=3155506 RepID=UPI003411C2C8
MAHELDITNGVTSFASARVHAWHRLGQVTPGLMSVDEALDAAHLRGWDVRLSPNQTTVLGEDGVTTLDTGGYSTVRTNPQTGAPEVLGGHVSDGYVPVQNEEQVEFLQALLDQSGAFIETAGALRGGRQVFLSARLPEEMTIGGVDPMQLYVSVLNGHDGSMALRAIASPVRIVCANTQSAALRSSQQRWSIRHTKGAVNAVAQARQTLGLAWKFNTAFEAEAERMIQEQLTDGEFDRLAAQLLGAPESKDSPRTRRSKARRLDTARWLFREAPTQQAVRGTRWAGYQAFTEFVDHYQGGSEDNRALSAVSGPGAKTKELAFDLLRVPA